LMERDLKTHDGRESVNMVLNFHNLSKVSFLFFIAYSYISFFDKWNWYIMYILNIVEKS
jgi:hypothetical protein